MLKENLHANRYRNKAEVNNIDWCTQTNTKYVISYVS